MFGQWDGQPPPVAAGREEADRLHQAVVLAERNLKTCAVSQAQECQNGLNLARNARQEFWMQTCVEPSNMKLHSEQLLDLYMKQGCRFIQPTREQTQEVLSALDQAMPAWDKVHPELFYQTVELNFPQLLRQAA
jgi:hypothetical protein